MKYSIGTILVDISNRNNIKIAKSNKNLILVEIVETNPIIKNIYFLKSLNNSEEYWSLIEIVENTTIYRLATETEILLYSKP